MKRRAHWVSWLQNAGEYFGAIGHFTVVCLVTWPMNVSEAGGDLALIQTSAFLI